MLERINSPFLIPKPESEHSSVGMRRRSLSPSVSGLLLSRAHLEISQQNIFFTRKHKLIKVTAFSKDINDS